MIGRSGGRGLGISVLAVPYDDDDEYYHIDFYFCNRWRKLNYVKLNKIGFGFVFNVP